MSSGDLPVANPSAPPATVTPGSNARRRVLRDLLVFQGKLFLDGVKDVIVSPLAIAAAVVGMVIPGAPGRYLEAVFGFGRAFDRWLNLFPARGGPEGIDVYLERIEAAIAREAAQGRVSERALEALGRAMRPNGSDDDDASTKP